MLTFFLCRSDTQAELILDHDHVRALGVAIDEHWTDAVAVAPPTFKNATLASSVPVFVLWSPELDVAVGSPDEQANAESRRRWDDLHDFDALLTYTFSLAMDVRIVKYREYQPVPVEEILADNPEGVFLLSEEAETRVENLAELPYVDAVGDPVRIYSHEQRWIPRYAPRELSTPVEHGALYSLRAVPSLFELPVGMPSRPGDDDYFPDPVQNSHDPSCVNLHPQSFTGVYGQAFASDIPGAMKPVVRRLNRTLIDPSVGTSVGRYASPQCVVRGIQSRGYNTAVRGSRERPHLLPTGQLTAGAARTFASTDHGRAIGDVITQRIETEFPFNTSYRQLRRARKEPMPFRSEQTYTLFPQNLARHERGGAFVYDQVVHALCWAAADPAAVKALKESLAIFDPKVRVL